MSECPFCQNACCFGTKQSYFHENHVFVSTECQNTVPEHFDTTCTHFIHILTNCTSYKVPLHRLKRRSTDIGSSEKNILFLTGGVMYRLVALLYTIVYQYYHYMALDKSGTYGTPGHHIVPDISGTIGSEKVNSSTLPPMF